MGFEPLGGIEVLNSRTMSERGRCWKDVDDAGVVFDGVDEGCVGAEATNRLLRGVTVLPCLDYRNRRKAKTKRGKNNDIVEEGSGTTIAELVVGSSPPLQKKSGKPSLKRTPALADTPGTKSPNDEAGGRA